MRDCLRSGENFSLRGWFALVLMKLRGDVPMPPSHAYRSGRTKIVCATLEMSDGRYCGNFLAIVPKADGSLEIHEQTCTRWDLTLVDALNRARTMAEAIYPPVARRTSTVQTVG